MRLFCALASALFLFAFISPAPAQDLSGTQYAGKICTERDLIGTFVMVDFRETPGSGETQFRTEFPYQYLAFYQKGLYISFAIDRQVKTADRLKAYMTPDKAVGNNYVLDNQGVLTLYSQNRIRYSYRCVVSLNTASGYQKGDIILTGYAAKSKAELYKLYRRWY